MTAGLTAIVLAAGKGTRMCSAIPKGLHDLCGRPILTRVLDAVRSLRPRKIVVVVSSDAERIRETIAAPDVAFAVQATPRGTGDAALQARPEVEEGTVLIVPGDVPLLSPELLQRALAGHRASNARLTVLTMRLEDPGAYGRVLRNAAGHPTRIVEAGDATSEQLLADELNTGIYFAGADSKLWEILERLTPENAQREIYLPDMVAAFAASGDSVETYPVEPAIRAMGINTRADLAAAAGFLRREIAGRLMREGVTLIDPERTYVESDVRVGRDTVIHPDTHLSGKTSVGPRCILGPSTSIEDSAVEADCAVRRSIVRASRIREGSDVGPFAHLRPGADVGPAAHIGSFVEVKASRIGRGAKVGHLAYVGDTDVGSEANIGAGAITCNYDGASKHRTVIGHGAFIGSNAALVAPITIGAGAVVAAGSTITEDVPPGHRAFGRARQAIKPPRDGTRGGTEE